MRNLKRALSLALATVMTLGLMVVGTGAVGYSDVTSEDNQEAIEVLQAVGIMTGVTDDEFDPDGLVTRNQIAVIMSNLLNLDYDYYRGINPFTDVPAWAAPYVAACAAEGVVAGIGGGLYGGENNVTAAQAALMLMKALGYFQYQGDFTPDWQVATIRQGSYIGLFKGVDSSAEAALTRGQVAQMVLNALKSDMVYFTGDVGTQITIGDTTVDSGYRPEYTPRTSADNQYGTLIGNTTELKGEGQYIIQLGEELYDGDLREMGSEDAFNRPATTWRYDGSNIGTYADEADLVYTEEVETGDIYSDLGLDETIATRDIDYTVDGAPSNTKYAIERRGDNPYGGQGVTTEVFYDKDAGTVVIAEINTYLAVVTDDDYTKDGEDGILVEAFEDGRTFFVEGGSYELDTVLLVQVADDEIQAIIGEPETVEGNITRISSKDALTIGGDSYPKAEKYTKTADGDVVKALDVADSNKVDIDEDISYTLYLDQYGNYLAIAELEDNSVSDLVYVYDMYTGTVIENNRARYATVAEIVRLDGTVESVTIGSTYADKDDVNDDDHDTTKSHFAVLTYDRSEEEYSLDVLTEKTDGTLPTGEEYAYLDVDGDKDFEEDDARVTLNNKIYYLNSDTVYIFITENDDGDAIDSVEVLVGGVNFDNPEEVDGMLAFGSGRDAEALVFETPYEGSSKNVLYFAADTKYGDRVESGVYTYDGYTVGETTETEFKVSQVNGSAPTSSTKLGGFYKYTVDSDGYYRLTYIDGTSGDGYDDAYVDEKNVYFKATSMDELKNGILTFNTDETAAARDAAVVDVTDLDAKEDEDGYNSYGKSVTSVSALERLMDNDYTVTAELFINKDNEVVAIFITKVTGGGSISESGDDGKENESQYGLLKTSGGDITVEINGRTLSLKNAKVVDTANGNKNVDFKEMDVSIKIERKSDSVQTGYVDETTITGPSVSSKGAVTGQESVIGAGNYEATLGYELSEGSYRVTFTFTGDVVGTITYVAPTLITIS